MDSFKSEVERIFNQLKDMSDRYLVRPLGRFLYRGGKNQAKSTLSKFSNALKDVKSVGGSGVLESTSPMTMNEMSKVVTRCQEANIKIAIKEVDKETNKTKRSKSKGTIDKIVKRQQRNERNNKIKQRFGLATKELKNNEKMYIAYVNTTQIAPFNRILEKVNLDRLLGGKDDVLIDRNLDGVIDEKDRDITTTKTKVALEDLQEGKEYGRFASREFQSHYVVQVMSKDDFVKISSDCHELLDHYAVRVREDGKVSVRLSSDELDVYRQFAPTHEFHEYGEIGGRHIHSITSDKSLEVFEFRGQEGERNLETAKKRFANQDYIVTYHNDGRYEMIVDKEQFEEMVAQEEKKYSTETLLEEANRFMERQKVVDNHQPQLAGASIETSQDGNKENEVSFSKEDKEKGE